MNELQLSKDLNVITAEINSYKQVAGQAIFEIGRRLKHVKENDLAHGEWINWLETIDFTPRHAQRFIKVTEEIGGNTTSMSHLGIAVMYEIATLPVEEREKEHTLENGETKTPDEMTVRELQEVKRKLREAEQAKQQAEAQAEQARKSEEIAIKKLEEEQSKEPEVIERNIVPDDYDKLKGGYAALEGTMNFYKEQNEELRNELKQLEQMIKDEQQERPNSDLLEELKESEEKLKEKINETYKFHELQSNLEQLLSMVLPLEHTINFDKLKDEHEMVSTFESTLDGLVDWCNDIKEKLPNNNIIEGEFIDE